MVPEVQIVLCIDTEGPCADPEKPDLLGTWDAVDAAVDKLFDRTFRARHPDCAGGGLKIGWFFLTWTGFTANPRERAFGYHAVRDHYLERWGELLRDFGDEQHWHYHHPPVSGVGNEWGLDWCVGDEYARILSRQALERQWFPACYRAGGTIMDERSSRWVDAWFPVDYSNRAPLEVPGFVDWSSGVAEWGLYHPSPEEFRSPGSGRRRMARCLDLQTDLHSLDESDVTEAFDRARSGKPALLACFDHDYRDIATRVDAFRELVGSVASRYPAVRWRYAAPLDAVRRYLDVPAPARLELDVAHHRGVVHVQASAPLFQSIPWLAVRTPDDQVVHLETDIVRLDPTRWRFTPPPDLRWEELVVAGSTDLGATSVAVIGPDDGPGSLFLRRRTEESPVRPRSIWDHSKYFVELCVGRASGAAPEMDAVRQAVDLLAPLLEPGMSVLDVGCAAGHLQRSLARFGVQYHGIDVYSRAVEVGRLFGEERGLTASSLRAMPLEELPTSERYDAVVSLSTLAFFPAFELPLEAMARAAERWLVVRACFGDETETRYLPDVLLEEGFQMLRAYMNVYSKRDVEMFLRREGFRVEWREDRRQRDRFSGRPEIVGGVELPYEFLFAERVGPRPSEEEILGEAFAKEAGDWRATRGSD
jgi:SAM-dependent methyltransferase